MRIIAKNKTARYTPDGLKYALDITIGFEYAVYAILGVNDSLEFLILDDINSYPVWVSSTHFDCIDTRIPNDWEFYLHEFNPNISRDWYLRQHNDFFKFIQGPKFLVSREEAYTELVEGYKEINDLFNKYIESQAEVSFIDDTTALYIYDKRKMKISMEKIPDGIILDSDAIQSWLPPYENELLSDSEKELIQKLISGYFEKKGIAYGWI